MKILQNKWMSELCKSLCRWIKVRHIVNRWKQMLLLFVHLWSLTASRQIQNLTVHLEKNLVLNISKNIYHKAPIKNTFERKPNKPLQSIYIMISLLWTYLTLFYFQCQMQIRICYVNTKMDLINLSNHNNCEWHFSVSTN